NSERVARQLDVFDDACLDDRSAIGVVLGVQRILRVRAVRLHLLASPTTLPCPALRFAAALLIASALLTGTMPPARFLSGIAADDGGWPCVLFAGHDWA